MTRHTARMTGHDRPAPSAQRTEAPAAADGHRRGASAELGLGLAAVGRPAYLTPHRDVDLPAGRSPEALEARTHELLDAAAASAITYVDVARSYGLAEQFVGTWLQRVAAPPFVASKWGYSYVADWRTDAAEHEVKEHSLGMLDRQWAQTADLLGSSLRLYQVHSLTSDSPLWTDTALLRRLAEVKAGGTELGLSTSGPAQAEAVRRGLSLTVDGVPLFTSVQTTWNLLEPSAGPALAEASAGGARVVVKEALANGRLLDPGGEAYARLRDVADAHGVGVDAVAIAAAMAQPWCDVVLLGPASVAQLQANLLARELALDPSSLLAPEAPSDYWARRSELPWS